MICLNCNKNADKKYCSNLCQREHNYLEYILKWKLGVVSGLSGIKCPRISNHIYKYLRIKYNNKCLKCGWNEKNLSTGVVPLEVDHKDGNWKNNKEDNLDLVCPNCHSLTPTFRALNRGNGRVFRLPL